MQSSNYSQTSSQPFDTDGQESDLLECCSCNQSVEQILALQCDHNLCLGCASQIVRQWSNKFEIEQGFPPLRCEICLVSTQVDPSAIMILRQMAESQTQLNYQWNHSRSRSRENFSQKDEESSNYDNIPKQETNMFQSLKYSQNNQIAFNDALQQNKLSLDCKQMMDQGVRNKQIEDNYEQNMAQQFSNQKQTPNYCSLHSNEIATLYCFTCECQCFCMECYLAGLHENHQVKNVQKLFNQFKTSQAGQPWFQIKPTSDTKLKNQCELSNKKIEIIDKLKQVFGTLEQINQSFQVLFQSSAQMNEYQQIIESSNYVPNNREKIEQIMENFINNRYMQSQNLNIQIPQDPSLVKKQQEEIKNVCLLISSLRGIETNQPTKKEKEAFEKAKEERRKRLFNDIVSSEPLKTPTGIDHSTYFLLSKDNKTQLNEKSLRTEALVQKFSQITSYNNNLSKEVKIIYMQNQEKKDNNSFSFIKRNLNEIQQQPQTTKSYQGTYDFRRNFDEARKQICDKIR